jgi:Kef-type K+ transport system membrane component KefB
MVQEYFSLLIIVILAFITPLLFTRIGVPVVVGEILLGLAVGFIVYLYNQFTGEHLLLVGESVLFLATIGFIFLMFLSGLELDFAKLEGTGKRIMVRGSLILVGTMAIAFPLSALLGEGSGIELDAAYMTLVLSTTSVAIVLTVVREMKISRTSYGQQIIIASLIADMGTMILITIFAVRLQFVQTGDPLFGVLAIVLFVLIFLFFFAIYKLGSWAMWYYPNLLRKFFRSDDPHEIGVRASLAIIFVFVAVSAVIESEALAVIGAFLAGAVISLLFQEGAILEKKLYGIGYGFLVPLFFITLGINFNFDAMLEVSALILFPSLFAIALLAKLVPALIFGGGKDWKTNLASGAILSGRLSLLIAAGEIGLRLGILDETLHAVIILLAIVFSVLSPTLFKYIFRRYKLEEEIA